MQFCCVPVLVVGAVLSLRILLAQGKILIKFQKAEHTVYDHRSVQNMTVFTRPFNRTLSLLNVRVFISEEWTEVMSNGALYKKSVVTYRPFLVNVTDDYCEFTGKNRGGLYLRCIASLFKPYSNIYTKCPIKGLMYIKDMPLEAPKLMTIFPDGDYRIDIRLFTKLRELLTVRVFLSVENLPYEV